MRHLMFAVLAAVLLGGIDASGQGPMAPAQPRPVWFSPSFPTTGLRVFEPNWGVEIASVNPGLGYFPGTHSVDPVYPAWNGQRTCMQVNAVPGAPVFVRWGLPPRATWPGGTLQQIGGPSVAFGTKVHSMIIATTGDMITLEDQSGLTHLVRYQWSGSVWQPIEGFSLGALYTIGRVTHDFQNTYWLAAWDTNQATNVYLWSWIAAPAPPSAPPSPRPTLTWLGQTSLGDEELYWITTERPVPPYSQGLIHVATRLIPPSREGYILNIFDPVANGWISQKTGGNQAWPDPTMGATGNGVISTFVALNILIPPPPYLYYLFMAGPCGLLTPIATGAALTGAMQVDFVPSAPGLVTTMYGGGPGWTYDYYSFPTCTSPATLLMQAPAGGVLDVLGYGWHYSQYITTGTVAYPF